jgi:hypothetical protein
MAPESLRTAMAMAVRFGAPRSHAFTLLRSPFAVPLRKQPCSQFSPRPRWQRSVHASPGLRSKPSYALPVVSSVQDATVTKSAGLNLANEALEFTKRSHECGKLTEKDVGTRVRVCGWVASQRSHGAIAFVNLRDHTGIVQVWPSDFFPRICYFARLCFTFSPFSLHFRSLQTLTISRRVMKLPSMCALST